MPACADVVEFVGVSVTEGIVLSVAGNGVAGGIVVSVATGFVVGGGVGVSAGCA